MRFSPGTIPKLLLADDFCFRTGVSVFLCAETCVAENQSEKAGKSMKIELPVFLVKEEDMCKRA